MKKIAFFISEAYMDYHSQAYAGVCKKAKELGIRVDVFSNFGILSANYLQTMGEVNIINLPTLSDYDGVIVAPDTINISDMLPKLMAKLDAEVTCPIVCIRQENPNYYNVLISNEKIMESIVDHFIDVHNCKTVAYLSGIKDMQDAAERLEGYKTSMRKHGLEVKESMIYHGDYWYTSGALAVDQFLKNGMPDAIVCANDYMAVGVMRELRARGISVPEDIKVSGFDCTDEGQNFIPRLATVKISGMEMGETAVSVIADIWDGKDVPKNTLCSAEFMFEGSCGCPTSEYDDASMAIYNEVQYLRSAILDNLVTNGDFENCETVEELLTYVHRHTTTFDYKKMYICLCTGEESEDTVFQDQFTEKCILRAIYDKEEGYIPANEIFDRKDILPKRFMEKPCMHISFSLHFRGHCMGYYVIDTESTKSLQEAFLLWSHNLSNYMDKVNTYEKNRRYLAESQEDSLTGLYNRRGLEANMKKKIQSLSIDQKMFILSIDMDGLKTINDNFGHLEGDFAIKTIGEILSERSSENIICARTGGDEYLVCFSGDEQGVEAFIKEIRKTVKKTSDTVNRGYEISVSIGHAEYNPSTDLADCINRADVLMYKDKSKKKNRRK